MCLSNDVIFFNFGVDKSHICETTVKKISCPVLAVVLAAEASNNNSVRLAYKRKEKASSASFPLTTITHHPSATQLPTTTNRPDQ